MQAFQTDKVQPTEPESQRLAVTVLKYKAWTSHHPIEPQIEDTLVLNIDFRLNFPQAADADTAQQHIMWHAYIIFHVQKQFHL